MRIIIIISNDKTYICILFFIYWTRISQKPTRHVIVMQTAKSGLNKKNHGDADNLASSLLHLSSP